MAARMASCCVSSSWASSAARSVPGGKVTGAVLSVAASATWLADTGATTQGAHMEEDTGMMRLPRHAESWATDWKGP